MNHPNPMVPDVDWTKAAEEFDQASPQQVILCNRCVALMGVTTPPQYVVVVGGESFCLDHLPRPPEEA